MSEPWVYPPQHTAVEVAAKLRVEIKECYALIESEKERRKRRSLRNEEKHEQAKTQEERDRIKDTWAYENREDSMEIARHEARLGEHRRLLQWLTGELVMSETEKEPMLDDDVVLQSSDRALVWAQLRLRVDLANEMGGALYRSIVADRVARIYEHYNQICGKS